MPAWSIEAIVADRIWVRPRTVLAGDAGVQMLIWSVIALLVLADAGLLASQGMTVAPRWPVIASFLGLSAVAIGYRRRSRFISCLTVSMAQLVAFSWSGAVLTYVAVAASPFPLADPVLHRADVALGFNWAWWWNFVNAHRTLRLVLAYAYSSIPAQSLGLVTYLAWADPRRVHELLLSAMLSILVIVPIMFVLPATGEPFHHVAGIGQVWSHDICALRSHTLVRLGELDGIVFFPSFHTVLGVLFAFSTRGRWLFPPMLLLNLLMIASVMSEGAHYAVDMLSGLAVAVVALWAVSRVLRQFRPASSRQPTPKS